MRRVSCSTTAAMAIATMGVPVLAGGVIEPHASEVMEFVSGSGAVAGYDDPSTVLGAPDRMTGGDAFPNVVSVFYPAWLNTQLLSLGTGGHVTVRFTEPVTDDPGNPYGVDLIVYHNAFFVDGGTIGGLFGEGGIIEVSADNVNWFEVPEVEACGLFPSQAYTDVGPYSETPGTEETDFLRPVHPALTIDDFVGLSFDAAMDLYDGSGGGAPVDLATVGLPSISYVRISNPQGGVSIEIDAFADVPAGTPGDTNRDDIVNVQDLLNVVLQWGPIGPGQLSADLNGDGVIDVQDLVNVILNWS